jgi:hypothetical protein
MRREPASPLVRARARHHAHVCRRSSASGRHLQDYRFERGWAPIIVKLEEYKRKHGEYPETVKPLATEAPTCTSVRDPYQRLANGEYCITCVTFAFNHHSYLFVRAQVARLGLKCAALNSLSARQGRDP